MKKIIALVDYKNRFGSKYNALPYRSGMNKDILAYYFNDAGFSFEVKEFHEVDFRYDYSDCIFLYTSSEDKGIFYKGFIEDIVYGLELKGYLVLPSFKYLRAHNNKVFMEILRDELDLKKIKGIRSIYFGCLEELMKNIEKITFPCVIKTAEGAMSKGVAKADNINQLHEIAKRFSRTNIGMYALKDYLRKFKHRGYIQESRHQKKFVIQNYINGLEGDYKILIFGKKYYVLHRDNRPNDFRASGSGLLKYVKDVPDGLLDYVHSIKICFNIPMISIDVGFDGKMFYLLEFQTVFFGSYTLTFSNFYFLKEKGVWKRINEKTELEKAFVDSIIEFLK